jgi:hypothetical protein
VDSQRVVSRLFALRIRAVEAERAFVRDEAEEKNNEANEPPTDRDSL